MMCQIKRRLFNEFKTSQSILPFLIAQNGFNGSGVRLTLLRCSTTQTTSENYLTKERAGELVLRLTTEERSNVMASLKLLEAEETRAEYQGQLAAFRWRSKFGRPSKIPRLGDVDPSGTYCPLPDDWVLRKYAETIPKPTRKQLFGVGLHNAVPFIGFGFLDNFVMIICGDSIEMLVGTLVTISTMAAAALGNTFSDILGISSAFYVEKFAAKLGVKAPNLSAIQMDMKSARTAANLGRTLGVTLGCILGMVPLLFKKDPKKDDAIAPTSS